MKELNRINETMSSREIAELTGKRHDNVRKDIGVLNENYEKLGLLKVEETPYAHPQNKQTLNTMIMKQKNELLVSEFELECSILFERIASSKILDFKQKAEWSRIIINKHEDFIHAQEDNTAPLSSKP